MTIDWNAVMSSLLGSLIGLFGAIAVAVIYIRNQNKNDTRNRVNERIEKTFFDNGILPSEAAITAYGATATYVVMDVRLWLLRFSKSDITENMLDEQLKVISKRPLVSDLIERRFSLILGSIPIIQRLGMPFSSAIGRTLQLYGDIVLDILNPQIIKLQFQNASPDDIHKSLSSLGHLIMETQLFLEKKFVDVKDYLWKANYNSYGDFLEKLTDSKFREFISQIEGFQKHVSNVIGALHIPDPVPRNKILNECGKWLAENSKKNLLE